jgi:hypothetical protein
MSSEDKQEYFQVSIPYSKMMKMVLLRKQEQSFVHLLCSVSHTVSFLTSVSYTQLIAEEVESF